MEFEPHQGKLEETVIGILKAANLETATELSVRKEAEKLLGVDLSDLPSKKLVRQIVESFLLSSSPVDEVQEGTKEVEEVQTDKHPVDDRKLAYDGGGRVICELPGMRRVSIKKIRGTKLVSIRDYYQKEGKVFPSDGGITLSSKQWSTFRSSFPDIEAAITRKEAGIRGEGMQKKQTDAEASNPSTGLAAEPAPPHPLIPIAPVRFTGRNYYCWKRQMDFFLKQLNISYVLFESRPRIPDSPEASLEEISESKYRAQKWINDDYICRQSILNSLSDQLFDAYSEKTLNARGLWEELKSSYADDFGTPRSHVNDYIQFQMVDGITILEQVEELHKIAGIITSCGIHIDENFHVSAIVSKLPPSWKHVRAKLMKEEYLPLDKLIYQLKDEEDCRKRIAGRNIDKSTRGKKKKKNVCFGCKQEGHKRQDCPLTKSSQRDQNQEGDGGVNLVGNVVE